VTDSYYQKGQRKKLVNTLHTKGIQDTKVLEAMLQVPRHFFFDSTFIDKAYEDKAFPIGEKQTISQPFTVAFQTELLGVQKREKILEIGTGSGYQAAILSNLGARVYTVERIKKLHLEATKRFNEYKLPNIRAYFRDGYKGLPEFAPFDKIIVTASAPKIPMPLIEQLKVDGILIIPIGGDESQQMLRIRKTSEENNFIQENHGTFRFVPMLEKKID
jgi:protein-L-isoaspartate(D-aspartate) O-methyltransferase